MGFVVAAASAAAAFIGGSTILTAVAGVATSFAVNAIAASIAGKPKLASPEVAPLRDRTVSLTGANFPRQVVYGQTRVPTQTLFMESTHGGEYLHLVCAIAGHEIEAVDTIYVNGSPVQIDGNGNGVGAWSGVARFLVHLGQHNQAADTTLVAECPSINSSDRFAGIAYIYARFKWDAERFQSGVPVVTADVRGRKVYDWRDATQSAADPATWKFSRNAVLASLDWTSGVLVKNEAGSVVPLLRRGTPIASIDAVAAISEANICDEVVSLAAGGSQSRYLADGVLTTGIEEFDGLQTLLTACAGRIGFSGGVASIRAGAARTAHARVITEADLLGPIRAKPYRSRDELFNSVSGQFVGAATAWKPGDFAAYSDSNFVDQDNGVEIWHDLELPFTSDPSAAQRIARLELALNRRQLTVQLECKMFALRYRVGDWVKVDNARRGWSEKTFIVTDLQFSMEAGEGGLVPRVSLQLSEIDANAFAWAAGEAAHNASPLTDLPNPLVMPAPLALTAALDRWNAEGVVSLTATPAAGSPPVRYEWRYRAFGAAQWVVVPRTTEPATTVRVEEIGNYDFAVRAVEASGPSTSSWIETTVRVEPENNLPRVAGLELAGGGHSQEFTGPDAQFAWRDLRIDGPAGFDVDLNFDGSKRDQVFKHYLVTIYTAAGAVMRTEPVLDPSYTYTLDRNRRDAARLGLPSAQRSITIGVRLVTAHNSGPESKLSVSNPAPAALLGLSPTTSANNLFLPFDFTVNDADHEGYIVEGSTVSGFDPGSAPVLFQGNANAQITLAANTWYVRAAAYDAFGTTGLNWSSELEVTVGSGVTQADLDIIDQAVDDITDTQLPALAGRIDVVEGQFVFQLVDGTTGKVIAGYALGDGTGQTSSFTILAELFAVVSSASDGTRKYPFIITDGVVTIDTAFIRDLGAENISVDELSAFTADLGTITAGLLRSPDDLMRIDLNGKSILMSV